MWGAARGDSPMVAAPRCVPAPGSEPLGWVGTMHVFWGCLLGGGLSVFLPQRNRPRRPHRRPLLVTWHLGTCLEPGPGARSPLHPPLPGRGCTAFWGRKCFQGEGTESLSCFTCKTHARAAPPRPGDPSPGEASGRRAAAMGRRAPGRAPFPASSAVSPFTPDLLAASASPGLGLSPEWRLCVAFVVPLVLAAALPVPAPVLLPQRRASGTTSGRVPVPVDVPLAQPSPSRFARCYPETVRTGSDCGPAVGPWTLVCGPGVDSVLKVTETPV